MYDGDGRWRLVPSRPDWMDGEQWAEYQAALADEEEPDDPQVYEDPDNRPGLPPPGRPV